MNIDHNTIQHLAALAKLRITPEEETQLQEKLSAILNFVAVLNEVRTDNVPALQHVTGVHNVLRPDEANYTFAKADMIASMPVVDDAGFLQVQAVFESRDDAA